MRLAAIDAHQKLKQHIFCDDWWHFVTAFRAIEMIRAEAWPKDGRPESRRMPQMQVEVIDQVAHQMNRMEHVVRLWNPQRHPRERILDSRHLDIESILLQGLKS